MTIAKGWRTLGFAALLALVGVAQSFNWVSVIPQNQVWSGAVMIAIGAAIAALRYVTTTSIGQK
jgi:hypothetical protein